jgi:hypothetical protein
MLSFFCKDYLLVLLAFLPLRQWPKANGIIYRKTKHPLKACFGAFNGVSLCCMQIYCFSIPSNSTVKMRVEKGGILACSRAP